MTAATLTGGLADTEPLGVLHRYRDDGPLASAAGRTLGRRVPLPATVLLLAAALPGAVAIVVAGAGASHGVVVAAIAWAVLVGGISSGRPVSGSLRWTVPPLVRALEYAGLLWIAAVAGESSYPAAFALLAVLSFHHYDTVYGTRHRGLPPARSRQLVAGGWDGRLVVATGLLLAGALPAAYYVAAVVLGAWFAFQSVAEWRRVGPAQGPVDDDDEEDEAV
jgi:hypothetical protein